MSGFHSPVLLYNNLIVCCNWAFMSASPSPSFANMNGHSTSKNVIQFQFKSFSPAPSATGSSVSAPKGTSSPNPLGTRDGEAYGVPGPGPSSDSTKEYTKYVSSIPKKIFCQVLVPVSALSL